MDSHLARHLIYGAIYAEPYRCVIKKAAQADSASGSTIPWITLPGHGILE